MGAAYKAVQWNRFKAVYSGWIALAVGAYLAAFVAGSIAALPAGQTYSEAQILIRAFGSCAFVMLSLVLSIGPLARLSPRFLPMLYNRRHLGVATFLVALAHAALSIGWYHFFGAINPLVSLLASNDRYESVRAFPFESLGAIALIQLFVMAATSHDFWNNHLGPGLWKALHMGVYAAYGLLVAHVGLGAIQSEESPVYFWVLSGVAASVAGLHLAAGLKTAAEERAQERNGEWLEVGPPETIPENRARIVHAPNGERIAVFRYDGKASAVTNVCRHQGGPLGEGKIVDGCITCPWHGFQYRPDDGMAPPPYTEKLATFRLKLREGVLFVDPEPRTPGEPAGPIRLEGAP